MGLLERAWNGPTVDRSWFLQVNQPSAVVTGRGSLGGVPLYGPGTVTRDESLSVPAIASACDLIASTGSGFPVVVISPEGVRLEGPDLPPVVARPDPSMSRREAVYSWLFELCLSGRVFWQQIKIGDEVMGLRILNPDEVGARYTQDGRYQIVWRGEVVTDRVHQVWWSRKAGTAEGLGPLQGASDIVRGMIAAQNHAISTFAESATPPLVLKTAMKLTKDQVAEELDNWDERHAGRSRTALLTQGVEPHTIQFDNRISQWAEARNDGVREIARLFHLPSAPMLASVSGSSLTYSNTAQQAIDIARFAVEPVLRRLEDSWSQQLPDGFTVAFDSSAYNRADLSTRSAYYSAAGGGVPWMTEDEIRAQEGLDASGATAPGLRKGAVT